LANGDSATIAQWLADADPLKRRFGLIAAGLAGDLSEQSLASASASADPDVAMTAVALLERRWIIARHSARYPEG
jgi:hypothetical protein